MDISIFLAQVIGVSTVLTCLGFIIHRKRLEASIQSFANGEIISFISGYLILILGLLVILNHNIWEASWVVLITIIGWLLVIKGAVRILLPHKIVPWTQAMIGKTWITVVTMIFLIIGIYLTYVGFIA